MLLKSRNQAYVVHNKKANDIKFFVKIEQHGQVRLGFEYDDLS